MSDILDDLKMLADHCDQENGDEPCDLGMLLIRAIAEIRNLRQQPVGAAEVQFPIPNKTLYGADNTVSGHFYTAAKVRTYGDAREAAGYAAGVAAVGWRDVADELPKEAQEVLFVRGGKTIHGAWIGGIFWHNNQKMAAAKWMPLPAPQSTQPCAGR